ncbi:methanol O-anthraniloyltransferase-like [Olea europaea subsp. europaea]|uniref:Methanol O-anthraniloyltransferase-like n=1 Tax=Olea europaea subsp. europaea TaxID=158383 RepID=A0A8S0PDJ9_OLEEU|nr:methanol O-anthraniloyltransferase-like [Olea europaea subsp. europaea]
MKGINPVEVIRQGLAKTLVYYYPFAGRIMEGENRKLMVDCNGEGVLFVEADACIMLEQLGDNILLPCPLMEEFLHDAPSTGGIIGCPLLLIQEIPEVSNHMRSPTTGTCSRNMLVWRICRLERCYLPGLVWLSSLPCESFYDPLHKYSCREELLCWCALLPGPTSLPIGFKSRSGYSNEPKAVDSKDRDETVRLSVIINLRGKPGLKILTGYYGSAFVYPVAVSTARVLCTAPLSYAVQLIKNAKAQMSEEYIKSVADLIVIKKRPKYATDWNFIVSDNHFRFCTVTDGYDHDRGGSSEFEATTTILDSANGGKVSWG